MNSSVLWIASPGVPRIDMLIGKLRAAGMLPVRVDSVDDALQLLTQFRAGVVVHQELAPGLLTDSAKLFAAGSPVVGIVEEIALAEPYLAAGCAAVVGQGCPATVLVKIVQDVAAGTRGVTWPERQQGKARAAVS